MGILATQADERVKNVAIVGDSLSVDLMDGRTIIVPLAWYPRLASATPAQLARWEIAGGGYGIHWPDLDEDLSTEGLLRGAPAPPPPVPERAVPQGATTTPVRPARAMASRISPDSLASATKRAT